MTKLYRVDFDWSLVSGAESAICSLWFDGPDGSATSAAAAALTAPVNTFLASYRAYLSTTVSLQQVVVNEIIEASGVLAAVSVVPGVDPTAGTNASHPLPPQCSVVVSVRTAVPGGKNRGRFYQPPFTAGILDTSGEVPNADLGSIGSYWATFIDAAIATTPFDNLVVYSRTARSHQIAHSLKLGSVIDTQRRRRNSLPERIVVQSL